MTTVQIVGIVVAAAIVLLLIIALLMTRRRGSASKEPPAVTPHASFLDDAPQDTLSALGKAEQPMEDVTIDPGVHREGRPADENAVPAPPVAAGTEERERAALGLDWGLWGEAEEAGAAASVAADETTGELPDEPPPARPAEGGSAASEEAAPEPGPGGRRVPLSDIIVTTSNKMVDLQDQEVRRMLTDLVKYEIDQATQYRQQGQTIDAVMQLTEAEKISRALDMKESAAAIRRMMEDLQRQV